MGPAGPNKWMGPTGPNESPKAWQDGKKYLEENKKKDGVIVLASGLQYKVLTKGHGLFHPEVGSNCECHYSGKLLNGTEFDSSYARGSPSTFAPDKVLAACSVSQFEVELRTCYRNMRGDFNISFPKTRRWQFLVNITFSSWNSFIEFDNNRNEHPLIMLRHGSKPQSLQFYRYLVGHTKNHPPRKSNHVDVSKARFVWWYVFFQKSSSYGTSCRSPKGKMLEESRLFYSCLRLDVLPEMNQKNSINENICFQEQLGLRSITWGEGYVLVPKIKFLRECERKRINVRAFSTLQIGLRCHMTSTFEENKSNKQSVFGQLYIFGCSERWFRAFSGRLRWVCKHVGWEQWREMMRGVQLRFLRK